MQPPPGPAGIRQYCFSCGCPGSDTATMRLECLSSLIFICMDGYDDMCLFVWKCLRPPHWAVSSPAIWEAGLRFISLIILTDKHQFPTFKPVKDRK